MSEQQQAGKTPRVRAPEFAAVDAWLNVERPLTMQALRGQVVVLDFWTYCCINCLHVLPDLQYLEDKYADEPVVVIGIHSGKFDQEKDAANIRQAARRHGVRHPVAVDSDFEIWNAYAAKAWPTLMVVDPEGYIVGYVSGEGHRQTLDRIVGKLLAEHRERGTLGKPLRLGGDHDTSRDGVLAFPGKVLADGARQRLFIADTGHHRVLVADLDGRVRTVIGSGAAGMLDGAFDAASLHQPQGMALSEDGRTLYIADTENHAVRAADLDAGVITTIAGTGVQSTERVVDGPASKTALNSPWDLARVGEQLYIAMAGPHQIWVLDLAGGVLRTYAGSGAEAATDGRNREAAFAQPSGLATDDQRLFVADAEVSSIRVIDLAKAWTKTLAGSAALFHFGHEDGPVRRARFQHPLGVALRGGGRSGEVLYVADTFNHVIRAIDLKTETVTTCFGQREPNRESPTPNDLFEPGGLSLTADTLFIADTNNHRIVAVDLETQAGRILSITSA